MAHKIDQSTGNAAFISYEKPAWHGLGKTFNRPITVNDALQQAALNYTVRKLPNFHHFNGQQIESTDSFFTFRTDTNFVLGSRLGKDYTVMQNADALQVVDNILNTGRATIETAGAIDNGKTVFICLKTSEVMTVGKSDAIAPYILIANSHDGTLAITAQFTNVRVVCNNTLRAALSTGNNTVKIRHTANASDRLTQAMYIMGMFDKVQEQSKDLYQVMYDTTISKADFAQYLGNVILTPDEIRKINKGEADVLSSRKQNILSEIVSFASKGTGQAQAQKKGELTAWWAYNAVTGYLTRKNYSSADNRAKSMLFGSVAETINHAAVLAGDFNQLQTINFN
jgi:phage/plasmid-like protein (TIGR03299 family)